MRKLATIEREITDKNNGHYIARFVPYRTLDDRIDGVVLNFIDITERARAEAALRVSEEKYRTLFDSIDEGFCIIELIDDEDEKVVDYRFLEVNQVFERQTGLVNVVGKLGSEIVPNTESHWLDPYQRVVQTGEPHRVENYNQATGRWYASYASRIGGAGSRLVALIFDDITERKQREEQQQYLLKLSDALRPLADATEIQQAATQILGEHFGVDRVQYTDIDENQGKWVVSGSYLRDGAIPFSGAGRIEDFGKQSEKQRTGNTLAIADAATDTNLSSAERQAFEAIEVRALLSVPLVKEGRWVATLSLHHSSAREWSEAEIKLAQETAERTWAAVERTRAQTALRESEEKYRTLFDSIDEGFLLCEVIFDEKDKLIDILYLEANPAAVHLAGRDFTGRRMREIDPNYEEYWYEIIGRVALTGEAVRAEHHAAPHGRWFDFYASKVGGQESRRVASVFQDITERKQREREQEFLLKLSDSLRAETNADDVANRALLTLSEELSLDRCYIGVYRLEDDRADLTHQVGNERVPPLPDSIRLSDFPEAFQVVFDRTLVIEDFAETAGLSDTDRRNIAALGLRGLVAASLRKGENKPLWTIVAVSASPRRWTQGEIALIEEVTERTWAAMERARAEEALRDSEERFQLAAAAVKAVIYDWDIVNDRVERSAELFNLLGFDATNETIKTNDWYCSRLHPEDDTRARALVKRAIENGSDRFEDEYRIQHKDGHYVWVNDTGLFLRDAEGRAVRCVGSVIDISARKQSDEALRESEQRIRALIENLPGGAVFLLDAELRYQLADGEALTAAGFKTEDFVGRKMSEVLTPELVREYQPLFEKAFVGEAFNYEHESHGRSYISRGLPLRDANGKVYAVMALSYDITDRKRAEDALRESEENLRLLIESIKDYAIFTIDKERRVQMWNSGAEKIFGWTESEIVGKSCDVIFTPEDRNTGVPEQEVKTADEEGRASDERWHVRKDGSFFFVNGVMMPLKDNGTGGYVKIARDLTEQMLAAEVLRASEERLKLATEAAALGSWDWDYRKGEMIWTKQLFDIFGLEPTENMKVDFEDIKQYIHSEDLPILIETSRRARQNHEFFRMEYRIRRADNNEERWISAYESFFYDEKKQPVRGVGIAQDITERKKAEQILLQSREELEQAVEKRTEELENTNRALQKETEVRLEMERERVNLLQQIVHTQEDERKRIARDMHDQLGQQLVALRLKLDLLKAECDGNSELCEMVEDTEQVARRIDSEIDFLARELRPVALEDLGLRIALENYVSEWSKHFNIPVEFHAGDLPDDRLPAEVEINLYRIVQEALNNVAKHSKAERVDVLIETRDNTLILIIEDNGKGFDESQIVLRRDKGLGILGMKEGALLMGGTLEIETGEGKGTTIFVRVPIDSEKK